MASGDSLAISVQSQHFQRPSLLRHRDSQISSKLSSLQLTDYSLSERTLKRARQTEQRTSLDIILKPKDACKKDKSSKSGHEKQANAATGLLTKKVRKVEPKEKQPVKKVSRFFCCYF